DAAGMGSRRTPRSERARLAELVMTTRVRSLTGYAWLTVLGAVAAPAATNAQVPAAAAAFDSARIAWASGDYVDALTTLDRILAGGQGAAMLDSVALLTGELYRTTELAPDGRNVRWSADGRHVLIDAGVGKPPSTTILTLQDQAEILPQTTIAGAFAATLSPDGSRIAYLTIDEDAELRAARARLDSLRAGPDRRAAGEQVGRIAA